MLWWALSPFLVTSHCIHGQVTFTSAWGCQRASYCRQGWQGSYSKTSGVLPEELLWGWFLMLSFPFPPLRFRYCIQVS